MLHKLQDIRDKRILISPLNWGLGHVTRIIPVIDSLLELDNDVIICCDKSQEEFLREFFPSLWYVPHVGYPFQFKGKGNFKLDMLTSYRKLKSRMSGELNEVQMLVNKFQPDILISDQRYGFRNNKVKSIFITHQINLPVKGLARIAQLQNKWMLSCFNEIWVADDVLNSLSGKLSKNNKANIKYLGNLSRFADTENSKQEYKYDYLGLISGPQPYSDQFFEAVFQKFSKYQGKTAIVVGHKMDYEKYSILGNCDIIVQPNYSEITRVINSANKVVSRCGYSTLMDLKALGKEAVLVGTKGQAEQEYLVELHKCNPKWVTMSEEGFKKLSL